MREEEEEAKRLEDEEKRKIKVLKQQEKDAKFAEEEKVRLATEEVEIAGSLLKIRTATLAASKDYEHNEHWQRFVSCDDKADPNEEKDITRVISKFEEEIIPKKLEIENLLKSCQDAEDLNNELLIMKEKARIQDDRKQMEWCQSYVDKLRQITGIKLDYITEHLANNCDLLIANKHDDIAKENANKNTRMGAGVINPNEKPEVLITYAFNDIGYGNWTYGFEKSGPRPKPIDFKEIGIQSEVPRTMVANKLIMRVCWTSYDYLSKVQYSKDSLVGGIVDVSCYQFLGQPEKFKELVLKKIYVGQDALVRNQYPAPDTTGVINYQSVTPVKIHFTLPKYVFIGVNDKIKVALWDAATESWNTEHIEDVKLDFDKKCLTVSTLELAPLAFVQERAIDFPYKSWKIRKTSMEASKFPSH